MLRESRNLKRRWVQGIFAVAFVVGLFWMLAGSPVMVKAGTLEYHASISSSTSGSDITFNCDLDQAIDGQRASYQWQENCGSGWQDISGATGASYTVGKTGRGGYQYRCAVTVVINNSYSLLNEDYKAFLHREGSVPEFQSWWPHLYGHTQNSYLVGIYDAIGIWPANEAARVATEMVFSTEYMSKYSNSNLNYSVDTNLATRNGPKQLIVDCYHFLLQRDPSNSEVEYWYGVYVSHNTVQQKIAYFDTSIGNYRYFMTYSGMGYVLNQIAASDECASKMAAAYYYDGNQGVFLYTESDIETRSDTYHVTSDVATIPENAYQVTLQKGTGIQSVSGAGSYTVGQSVTINATLATGYHWKGWTGTYQTTTKRYTFSMPGQDVSMTASAEINHSTLKVDPNGGTWNGSADVQSFSGDYGTTKSIPDPVRPGYTFAGWIKSDGFHGSLNNAVYTFGADNGVTDVLTASWTAKRYKVILQKGTGIQSVSGAGSYTVGQSVKIDAVPATGYHWKGWTGTYETDTKQYMFSMPMQDVSMTADAEINHSTLRVDPNGGTWNGSADVQSFTENYGVAKSIPDPVRPGYTFSGWVKSDAFHGSLNNAVYTFGAEDGATDILTASWTANSYTLHFDPNGGAEVTHIEDMVIQYDEEITLPDAEAAYVKYTFDGQNVTQDVLSGAIRLESDEDPEAADPEAPEDETDAGMNEEATDPEAENEADEAVEADPELEAADNEADPEADQRAYASVNTGWVTEEEKENFNPIYLAGDQLTVAELVDRLGVTDQNGANITLYASWDDCPWIVAVNLYYTLSQAQQGFITDSEILSHATASDREDGSPIEPGFHENGTSFSIPDYQAADFTQFRHAGSCTENLTVVDSAGSMYYKQITVYVVDTAAVDVKPDGTTRFISEKYYEKSYEQGGLEDNSVWKTDPEYVAALRTVFDNLKNDTPIATYRINYDTRHAINEYVDAHGFGNSREAGALQGLYELYLAPNRTR